MPYRITKRTGGDKVFLRVHNSGYNGKSIFRTSADYNKFISILARLSRETPAVGVVGYVLMRDSFDLVLEEFKRSSAAAFLHKLSVSYAMYFQYKYQQTGKLFKGPYKDSVLVSDDEAILYLSQIHHLPESLNKDIELYEWSSYHKYLHNQGPWLNKQLVINYFKTADYQEPLKDFTSMVIPIVSKYSTR